MLVTSEASDNRVLIFRFYPVGYSGKDEANQDYIGLLNLDVYPAGRAKAKGFIAKDFCMTNTHIDEFVALCKQHGVREIENPKRGIMHGSVGLFIRRINERLNANR